MYDTQAFAPAFKKAPQNGAAATGTLLPSVTVAASATAAASGKIPGASPDTNTQIQIANLTDKWAFVNFGTLALTVVAATVAASYPVAPGTVVVVTVEEEVDAASVILTGAAGSATSVIFTRGQGI